MTDIKIKRYADKENLKKLMKYSKDTFVNKSEINKFYTKEQIDSMLEGVSGGTGGGGTGDNYYTKSEIDTKLNSKVNTSDLNNYYTREQINSMLARIVINQQVLGGFVYNADIDEYNNETEQTMKTVSVESTSSVNAYTIVENSDTVEEL